MNITSIMSNITSTIATKEFLRNPITISAVALVAAGVFAVQVYRNYNANKKIKLLILLDQHDELCKKVQYNFSKQEDKNSLLQINYEISNETLDILENAYKKDTKKTVDFIMSQFPPFYRSILAYPKVYADFRNEASGEELKKYFTKGTVESTYRDLQIKFCKRMDLYRKEFQKQERRYHNWTIPDLNPSVRAAQDSMPT